ncbi:MAG: flagellar hook-length control protein FliK [Pontibacterium sp.]
MFPENLTSSLLIKDSPAETQKTLGELFRTHSQLSGTVISSAENKTAAGTYSVKISINNQPIYLSTQQPLPAGSQLQINQSSDGAMQLKAILPTTTSQQPAVSTPQATPAFISLAPGAVKLQIPTGSHLDGTVLKSTPLAPATTTPPPQPREATYDRPLPPQTRLPSDPGTVARKDSAPTTLTATATQGAARATASRPTGGNPGTMPSADTPPGAATTTAGHRSAPLNQTPANAINPAPASPVTTSAASQALGAAATPAPAPPDASTVPQKTTDTLKTAEVFKAPLQAGQITKPATNARPVTGTAATTEPGTATKAADSLKTIDTFKALSQTGPATETSAGTPPGTARPATSTAPQFLPGTQIVSDTPTNRSTPALPGTITSSGSEVLPPGNQAPAAGKQFTLQVLLSNGRIMSFTADTAIAPDTSIRLTQSGPNNLQATLLPQQTQTADSLREQSTLQDTLRTALPAQHPLADILSQIQTGTRQSTNTALPALVRSILQLFGVRPGSAESPETVRNNVQLGGIQAESQLAQTGKAEKRDFKTLIRQLQQHTAELPPEQRSRLEQLIQSAQSRITHNQVASLQQWKEAPDGSFERVFQLDIPVLQNNSLDNLDVRISQEGQRQPDDSLSMLWRVRLHFDLAAQGTVDAEIKLSDEEALSIQFWCTQAQTHEDIQNQLSRFGHQLSASGFPEPEISCYHGNAPHTNSAIQTGLVDIHT